MLRSSIRGSNVCCISDFTKPSRERVTKFGKLIPMMNGDGTILGEYIEERWNQPSRDIYWLGRQGCHRLGNSGGQSEAECEIYVEAFRIWDDGLADSKLDQNWSDAEDFAEEL